jgi:two-component sensor histidine kinase
MNSLLSQAPVPLSPPRETERALREDAQILEALYRVGATVSAELDLGRAVQVVTDAATELTGAAFGSFFYNVLDERGESYMLYTLSGVPRDAFSKFPMPRNTAVFGPTFRGEGIVRSDDITKDPRYGKNDPHRGMPEGHLPVRSYLAAPVVSRSGEVLGGLFFGHPEPGVFTERAERILAGIAPQAAIAIDNARLYQAAQLEIAERRKVEAHQQFLLAELNHRVRNMLAVVMGIASQTARGSDSVRGFTDSFLGRLTSLARAHTMLTDRNWNSMPLGKLVEDSIAGHVGLEDPRISMSGADVTLDPKTTVSISMILHELMTNAAKHGALSSPNGRIEIAWELTDGNGAAPRLRLGWSESGVSGLGPPTRRGFGTRMIEMTAAHELGGAATLSWRPHGLHCGIEFPLRQ